MTEAAAPMTLAQKYPDLYARLSRTVSDGKVQIDEANAALADVLERANTEWAAKLAAEEAKRSEGRKEFWSMIGGKIFGAGLAIAGLWTGQNEFVEYGAMLAGLSVGGLQASRAGVKMVKALVEARRK